MGDACSRGRLLIAGLALLASARCGDGGPPPANTPSPPDPASGVVVVAAGDIANCGSSGAELTAQLLDAIFPAGTSLAAGLVLPLGDNAYNDGTLRQYQQCYAPTWGRHLDRSRPVPGNHDYHTPGAAGYFDYFGSLAGTRGLGYYSYTLGAWHLVALNSNCDELDGGCARGSAMERWLRDDLARNTARCTLAYWHHPRFSTGAVHGSDPRLQDIWATLAEFDADVVLAGHEHLYERTGPRSADGGQDTAHGLRQFVVGTGGRSLYAFRSQPPEPDVEARENQDFGVLRMTLRVQSYAWQFMATSRAILDEGEASCH